MPNIDITIQDPSVAGLNAAYTALNDTDVYFADRRDGRLLLHFKNTTAGDATITIDVTKTQDGVAFADPTVTVPASTGERFVGAFGNVFVVNADDEVKFACSKAAGVSVAALDAI